MYRVTNKKSGYVWNFESLEEAKTYVRGFVLINNMEKRNSDRKTNYIIEEV